MLPDTHTIPLSYTSPVHGEISKSYVKVHALVLVVHKQGDKVLS